LRFFISAGASPHKIDDSVPVEKSR